MTTTTLRDQRLSDVQDEIEALLASRPFGDLSQPCGYRSLVKLESVLLQRTKCARVQIPCEVDLRRAQ